ncbi:MAG: gamma-glutamyl-gamma-aminobutyrate hydrolase family protein [Gemmatimonadales bacterium]|nr:gamma-glutamyl-gamma-aminobutyrate hydrolase family protein [Gemmatimonadales bacterium]
MADHPRRPVIGVPTQTLHSIDGIPEGLPSSWVMNQRYFHVVAALGALPWMIPLFDDDPATLRGIYERLDGIMIPGGVDMQPEWYREAPHEKLGRTDPARDEVELQLTKWAVEDGKPLFGLCRGIQVLNVALGGSLFQDIEAQIPDAMKHDYFPTQGYPREHIAHHVDLAKGSRFARWFGNADRIPVNSMHHQAIRELAPGLAPVATSPDGLVEAVELDRPGTWIVAVQWHPESFEPSDPRTRGVFEAFLREAGKRAA